MLKKLLLTAISCAVLGFGSAAFAATCDTIRFVDMPWTGNLVKTELAAWMLDRLGYKTHITTANLGVSRMSVAKGQNDVSFGLWLPSARPQVAKYMVDGKLNILSTNVDDARYTLAVPDYVYDAGVKHISDLDRYQKRFGGKIYGIGPATDGNRATKEMIDDDAYGLGDWELVASSEAGMLAQVQKDIANHDWVVWIGWTPHPMTINIDMRFLNGADEYFGPNGGGASVYTVVHPGFAWRCRNVGQFLKNYRFKAREQSRMAKYVLDDRIKELEAGQRLVRRDPDLLQRWFGHGGMLQDGPVKSRDGKKNAADVIAEVLSIDQTTE